MTLYPPSTIFIRFWAWSKLWPLRDHQFLPPLQSGRSKDRTDKGLAQRKLAELVEKRQEASHWSGSLQSQQTGSQQSIHFLRKGDSADTTSRRPVFKLLVECRMKVDLGMQLHFRGEIWRTTLRPDMVLCSVVEKSVLLVEHTMSWEEGVEVAH